MGQREGIWNLFRKWVLPDMGGTAGKREGKSQGWNKVSGRCMGWMQVLLTLVDSKSS